MVKSFRTPNESELIIPKTATPAETSQAAFVRDILNSS